MAVRRGWPGSVPAALVLLVGGAGSAAAAPAHPAVTARAGAARAATTAAPAQAVDYCGASATDLRPGPQPPADTPPAAAPAPVAAPVQPISYTQPQQLPIGMWSAASVTLRAPAARGTVRLDLASTGFSTDSMEVQRWVPAGRHWVDLAVSSSNAAFPTSGSFSFGWTGRADATHPETVQLRLQDLDRPGSLRVAASLADGHGHTYRAPALRSPVTRPQTAFTGWPAHAALTRGGSAQSFTLTVHNTTDRAYPAVTALFFAYGMGGGRALTPRDLVLQQYVAGHGWTRLPLVASGCDPGMSVALRPAAGVRLAPGATATVRLRLAVARTASRAVRKAEAGLSVQSGDTSLASRTLPFTVRG